jgi:putative Holliday junction resolvase
MTSIVSSPDDLRSLLTGPACLIGLDLGSKTIGVAVSDRLRTIASPRLTIRRSKFAADAAQLIELAASEQAAAFVLGLPINMDGSAGPRVQATHAFARNLAKLTDLPIALWDERLSTAAVERMLIEADRSRSRRAELIDKLAAAWILQGALDRLAGKAPVPAPGNG